MKDYTFIRPGIAVTISAVTLALALVIGVWLVVLLNEAARTVTHGANTVETLHRYNAGLEVWRQMSTSTDAAYQRPEAVAQRDSIGRELRVQLAGLANNTTDERERTLVQNVLLGISGATVPGSREAREAREAMIVLLARQDSAMFHAAQASQQAVLLSAILLALTIVAAGTLIVPMAWLYVRYKRGATIEVKV
jgi:hypothetical protein